MIHSGIGGKTITASSTRLLVVGSYRLRDTPVSYKSDTALVHPHTKGDCSCDHCHLPVYPVLLHLTSLRPLESRMVGQT